MLAAAFTTLCSMASNNKWSALQIRNLKKKLQQIEALEARQQDSQLDPQQQAKLAQRAEVCATLDALHGGASLEEAHKVALSHRPSASLTTPPSSIRRSPSTLSVDSSGSKSRSSTGKQRASVSRLSSRQDLSQSVTQADCMPACAESASQGDLTLPSAERPSQSPDAAVRTHAHSCTPATQLATPLPISHPPAAGTGASFAAAAASAGRPSAWGQANTSPVASFRVSGFSTPQGHRTEPTAWATPTTVSPLSFGATGGSAAAPSFPNPSAAAKKAKPPRKGGLSMFLSGETSSHV